MKERIGDLIDIGTWRVNDDT